MYVIVHDFMASGGRTVSTMIEIDILKVFVLPKLKEIESTVTEDTEAGNIHI